MSLTRLLALAAITLALAGCFPGAAWLPDSSGFYYTSGKKGEQLKFFDVKTKKATVIAEDTKTNCLWPAVSPDGKRIALVNMVKTPGADGKGQGVTLEVVVLDKDGKEKKRTKAMPWAKVEDKGGPDFFTGGAQAFWIPKSEKLLIGDLHATGIFDLSNDNLTKLDEVLLLSYAGTPFRPDGQGFLGLKAPKDKKAGVPSYAAFDFNGKETGSASVEGFKEDPMDKDGFSKLLVLIAPEATGSAWTKDGATSSWGGNKLTVDLAKKSAKFEEGKAALTDDGKKILHAYPLKGGASVRIVELPKKMDPKELELFPPARIEVVTGGKAKVLMERADVCVFLPAPDGQTVALRCTSMGMEARDVLFVLNGQGEVLAELKEKH